MEFNNETLREAVKLYLENPIQCIQQYGEIGTWNVSKVTNMSCMFRYARAFNQDISDWNVSNVTDMHGMFYDARAFNQDISNWNVSKVTNMGCMFYYARAFNQDISNWNVSNVTDMHSMFFSACEFNQNISMWNVSNVTNMEAMFFSAYEFNQNISMWNVSKVTNMEAMFFESELLCKLLAHGYNDINCLNARIVKKVFNYERRENFLLFLIRCGFIIYKGKRACENRHKVFEIEDMYKSIMAFV